MVLFDYDMGVEIDENGLKFSKNVGIFPKIGVSPKKRSFFTRGS